MTLMWPRSFSPASVAGGRAPAPYPGYYEPCAAIVYVVDAADRAALAEAWVELSFFLPAFFVRARSFSRWRRLYLLNDAPVEKSVTVVLNKTDAEGADVAAVKRFMNLGALAPRIAVLEGSVTAGGLVDDVRDVVLAAAAR